MGNPVGVLRFGFFYPPLAVLFPSHAVSDTSDGTGDSLASGFGLGTAIIIMPVASGLHWPLDLEIKDIYRTVCSHKLPGNLNDFELVTALKIRSESGC